jgi:hypothetical protein
MTALNLTRIDEGGTYSLIFNKGVETRTIFNDQEDYDIFTGFLRDYLVAPIDPEASKKEFTVNGRTFRGTPHQPKNYFNKVELLAYNLEPDSFNLLLHQVTQGSIERFVRSLCTRYSMYFNKKYARSGALFQGPYKSAHIKDEVDLLGLTRDLHLMEGHSSFLDYLGARLTAWVKPGAVLNYFDSAKTILQVNSYKEYVEKLQPPLKTQPLVRSNPSRSEEEPVIKTISSSKNPRRIPEFGVLTTMFLLLTTLGVRNIQASTRNEGFRPIPTIVALISRTTYKKPSVIAQALPTAAPEVLSSSTEEIKPPETITIYIKDGSPYVNIRLEPVAGSKVIGSAKNGDVFEFLSVNNGWYEIKLSDGATGFVSESVTRKGDNLNQ